MYTRSSGWFWVLVTVLSLALVFPTSAEKEKSAKEKKVAIVNGTPITKAEFDKEFARAKQQLSQGRTLKDTQLETLKKRILEELIDRELLYQASQKQEIKVDESKINKELDKIKKRFSSNEEFKSTLNKMGLSEKNLKLQMKKEIAIQTFINKEFVQEVSVSEKEMKSYYDENPELFKQPEQVKCSHILIQVSPKAETPKNAKARKELKEVQEKLDEGQDFSALAKEYSQGPYSENGGNLGYIRKNQMPKAFEEVAFSLEEGKVSDIVETQFGYHLIKVHDKKSADTVSYKNAKDEIEQNLKYEKVREKVSKYLEEQKKSGEVKRLVSFEESKQ